MRGFSTIAKACDLVTDGTHYTPTNIGTGVPFLTVKDVTDEELDFSGCSFISDEDFKAADLGNSAPKLGDVLFSKDGTVGKVHVISSERPFAVLSSLAILRPKKGVLDSQYLGHALRSPTVLGEALKKKTGSAIRRTILSDLKKVVFPLPPLPEQHRIAAILDKADALRAKRLEALAQLDELTQSIFMEMFGDPVQNTKKMPMARLSDIAIFENGDRSSNYPSGDEIKESGVLFLSTKNITNHQPDLTTRSFITESKFASLSRGKAQKGELLITLRGTLGSSCIFDCEYETAFINAQMMIIRPKSDLRPQYLHALISSRQFQVLFNRIGQGAAVPQLTAPQLGQLEIPVPTADLQLSFADKISATKMRRHRKTTNLLNCKTSSPPSNTAPSGENSDAPLRSPEPTS